MNCVKCGKENREGDKFCGGCGALLMLPPAAPAAGPGTAAAPQGTSPAAPAPGGQKPPIPQKVILIAIAAALVLGGGLLAYNHFGKKDDARLTLQVGDEKITIGTEDLEKAAKRAGEEAERLAKEGEELAEEGERAVERGLGVSDEEPASNSIRGKIVGSGWKKFVVKSLDTGKTYTVNVGRVTTYSPKRKAEIGDTVRVTIQYDRGRIIGTRFVFE